MGRFETLLNEVTSQNEETLLTYFIGGLKPEIKNQLKINWPTSLRKALVVAKVHEANKGYKSYKFGEVPLNSKSDPLPKSPPIATRVPIVRRTLTVEERKERTAKGLCFNCDEQYKPSHKFQGKLFCLCAEKNCLVEVLEPVAEDVEVEAVGGEIEISMHALSGSFNPRTICLAGSIGGQ